MNTSLNMPTETTHGGGVHLPLSHLSSAISCSFCRTSNTNTFSLHWVNKPFRASPTSAGWHPEPVWGMDGTEWPPANVTNIHTIHTLVTQGLKVKMTRYLVCTSLCTCTQWLNVCDHVYCMRWSKQIQWYTHHRSSEQHKVLPILIGTLLVHVLMYMYNRVIPVRCSSHSCVQSYVFD